MNSKNYSHLLSLLYPYLPPSVQLKWRFLNKRENNRVKPEIPLKLYLKMSSCKCCRSELLTKAPNVVNNNTLFCNVMTLILVYDQSTDKYKFPKTDCVYSMFSLEIEERSYRQMYRYGKIDAYRDYIDRSINMEEFISRMVNSLKSSTNFANTNFISLIGNILSLFGI
jgi:hypothetical protein